MCTSICTYCSIYPGTTSGLCPLMCNKRAVSESPLSGYTESGVKKVLLFSQLFSRYAGRKRVLVSESPSWLSLYLSRTLFSKKINLKRYQRNIKGEKENWRGFPRGKATEHPWKIGRLLESNKNNTNFKTLKG